VGVLRHLSALIGGGCEVVGGGDTSGAGRRVVARCVAPSLSGRGLRGGFWVVVWGGREGGPFRGGVRGRVGGNVGRCEGVSLSSQRWAWCWVCSVYSGFGGFLIAPRGGLDHSVYKMYERVFVACCEEPASGRGFFSVCQAPVTFCLSLPVTPGTLLVMQ